MKNNISSKTILFSSFKKAFSTKSFKFLVISWLAFLFNCDGLMATPLRLHENDGQRDTILEKSLRDYGDFDVVDKSFGSDLDVELYGKNFGFVLNYIDHLDSEKKQQPKIIYLKIRALIGMGQLADAQREFHALNSLPNVSVKYYENIANDFLRIKKGTAVMAVCQAGLQRDIHSSKLLFMMGLAYNLTGKTQTAIYYFDGALASLNTDSELYLKAKIAKEKAVSYYKLNEYEKAKNSLSGFETSNTNEGLQLIIDAKYNMSKGDNKKAIVLLNKTDSTPQYLEAKLLIAQMYILEARTQESIELLNGLESNFNLITTNLQLIFG
ncbi:lipopolysaccharide assembly protein LapB [Desulforhopalus sp. IMCC35007]|uniref:tetratricopeptide repeat protein n=1 Tax=Desulforhopalus sp. IMCC35007 TaxID=2569543 RepID=UPI0010AE69C6|nr:hypothetical protein [Desulforhopalus sp. IMCC35007]TKB12418.1 hypothetical protein FCL48_01850 [Desulforhopalus sp. IMCC35007]